MTTGLALREVHEEYSALEEALMDYELGEASEPEALSVVRDLARKAYGDAIPELIDGASVAEIMSSVDGARAAYARVFAAVQSAQEDRRSQPPAVPAGGSGTAIVDVDRLPPSEKLRLGVGAAKRG